MFLDATMHLYIQQSLHTSARPSVCPVLFLNNECSYYDIIINDKMSDDEVVASDVPLRYLFLGSRLLTRDLRSGVVVVVIDVVVV